MHYSIVIPTWNEEKNVVPLYAKIKKVMDTLNKDYEIIFIEDCSTDATYRNLMELNKRDKRVRIIKFRTHSGQTAAMDAGFKHAQGSIIIAMDADLQNDPEDIPRLLAKMKQGYDCVSGWRFDRKDDFGKKFWSLFARMIRFIVVRDGVHDSGCSLKVYRKECFDGLNLYGEMHRYIPALLMWRGFRIGEIKVKHHKRKWGKTKYSVNRLFKGFMDLMVVSFWQRYSQRPIHLFGGIGVGLSLIGVILGVYLLVMRLFFGMGLSGRWTPFLAVILFVIGLQFFLTGLMADIMVKNYYKDRTTYNIEKII